MATDSRPRPDGDFHPIRAEWFKPFPGRAGKTYAFIGMNISAYHARQVNSCCQTLYTDKILGEETFKEMGFGGPPNDDEHQYEGTASKSATSSDKTDDSGESVRNGNMHSEVGHLSVLVVRTARSQDQFALPNQHLRHVQSTESVERRLLIPTAPQTRRDPGPKQLNLKTNGFHWVAMGAC